MKNKYQNLSKLLPVGSILLILFSSIKIIIFYNQFDINIVDFIELDEYATLFMDDLIYYLLFFGINFYLVLDIILLEQDYDYKSSSSNENNEKKSIKKKIITLILGVIIIILITLLLITSKDNSVNTLNSLKMLLIFLLLIIYKYLTFTNINLSFFSLVFLLFLTNIIMDALIDAKKIKTKKPNYKYTLILNEKKIETNKNLKYIGKTKKYTFLYNIKEETAQIINNEQIKTMLIKKRNYDKKRN